MRKNTNSNNTMEPFSLSWTRERYEEAESVNNNRHLSNVPADEFPGHYTSEQRGDLNQKIWNGILPAEHPTKPKRYKTVKGAYRKLIFDAEFYAGDWEEVKEIASRSPYRTQF